LDSERDIWRRLELLFGNHLLDSPNFNKFELYDFDEGKGGNGARFWRESAASVTTGRNVIVSIRLIRALGTGYFREDVGLTAVLCSFEKYPSLLVTLTSKFPQTQALEFPPLKIDPCLESLHNDSSDYGASQVLLVDTHATDEKRPALEQDFVCRNAQVVLIIPRT